MRAVIFCIVTPIVVVIAFGLSGYTTIKEKSQQIEQAKASMMFADNLSFMAPNQALRVAARMQSFPGMLEVLEAASEEIEGRWFGWLYNSGVREQGLVPHVKSLTEASQYFAQDSFQKGLDVYHQGPGKIVGKELLIKDLPDFGDRDINAFEETFRKYKIDLVTYTVVKGGLLVVFAIGVVFAVYGIRRKKRERANATHSTGG